MTHLPLEGVTVVSFESRMADETSRLIEKRGGTSISAPSMQEVPLDRHDDVFKFGERLFREKVEVLVLLTGVGTRMLVDTLATRHPRETIVDRLDSIVLLARGPKPVRALREMGLRADLEVPEPNTWRELLELVDTAEQLQPLRGKQFAIQEYGTQNEELVRGLEDRGAAVEQVSIYRWALPDDLGPLRRGMRVIIDGTAQIALFTSRTQVDHLMQMAEEDGVSDALRQALNDRAFVGSIGPVCSEGLREHGIEPDLEPEHPKLGVLIRDVASGYAGSVTA
ncbi:MAG: uroporphyrinogen-III synthase [Rhodothermales bacterium]